VTITGPPDRDLSPGLTEYEAAKFGILCDVYNFSILSIFREICMKSDTSFM
jgi:hypothetical protein